MISVSMKSKYTKSSDSSIFLPFNIHFPLDQRVGYLFHSSTIAMFIVQSFTLTVSEHSNFKIS